MSGSEKTGKDSADHESETVQLEYGIQQTRSNMSETLAALETRLRPAELRDKLDVELHHVTEKLREVVKEQLADAKTLVQEELVEAKSLLRTEMNEAEVKIKEGLSAARETVKKDLHEAVTGAKESVRAATLGKVEDLATGIGDTMNRTRDTLIDTVRQNPLPAALAGIGIAWLLMNRSHSASTRAQGDRYVGGTGGRARRAGGGGVGDAFAGAQHAASHVVGQLGNAVHHATDVTGNAIHNASHAASSALHDASSAAGSALNQASDAAGAALHNVSDLAGRVATQASGAATLVAEGTRSQARRVEQLFQSTLHENPLALGAGALVLGAAVGIALPRTRGEDSLMGATRDDVLHKAEDAAHEAADALGRLTEKAVENTKEVLAKTEGISSSPR